MARATKGCQCPKHFTVPVAGRVGREWNWEVFTHQGGYPLGAGGAYMRLPSSSVTCHACNRVWRTRAKYVDRLWARDAGKRREQARNTQHLRGLEFTRRAA